MTEMECILHLYDLMAARLEKSEFGARQAKIYRETIDFMKDCPTADDAMKKIKNSPYYLGPGIALVLDTIDAECAAARETGMDDLAAVYEAKKKEIEADGTAIYDTAYQETAKREKAAYFDTMEAFSLLFRDWITARLGEKQDEFRSKTWLRDAANHAAALKKPSASFRTLAALPSFRGLIPVEDPWYRVFVEETAAMIERGALPAETEDTGAEADPEAEWEKVKAELPAIEEAGRRYLSMTKEASAMATAPDSIDGGYTYSDERVR